MHLIIIWHEFRLIKQSSIIRQQGQTFPRSEELSNICSKYHKHFLNTNLYIGLRSLNASS